MPLSITRPGKIVCVGLNYHDHAEEGGAELPKAPLLFAKWANTLIGHGEPIVLPAASKEVDYEAELGVVIGRRVRGLSAWPPRPSWCCRSPVPSGPPAQPM